MSYAQAFQPLLSLLGQRADEKQRASLLQAQQAREDALLKRDDERYKAEGLLKRQAEARAAYADGFRRFTPGMLNVADQENVGTLQNAAVADAPGADTAGLLMRAVAPVVRQQGAARGAAEAEALGGWIRSALSDQQLRDREQARERRGMAEADRVAQDARDQKRRDFETQQTDKEIAARKDLKRMEIGAARERAGERTAQPKPPTAAQLQAQGFYDRMRESGKILDAYETGGTLTGDDGKPVKVTAMNPVRTIGARAAGVLPLVGASAQNALTDSDRQRYWNAASNWVRANLRKESGAAIGAEEMDKEIATYFPQAGDSPAVIKQKRELRKVTESAMARMANTPQEESVVIGSTGRPPLSSFDGRRP